MARFDVGLSYLSHSTSNSELYIDSISVKYFLLFFGGSVSLRCVVNSYDLVGSCRNSRSGTDFSFSGPFLTWGKLCRGSEDKFLKWLANTKEVIVTGLVDES